MGIFVDLPRQFDAGRAGPHHHEGEKPLLDLGILLPVGLFELPDDVVVDSDGVLEILESEGPSFELDVSEEVRLRPQGDDQIVVGKGPVGRHHLAVFEIDFLDRPHMGVDSGLAEDFPDRMGHIPGLESAGRHAMQKRGEEKVVPPVHHRHPDIGPEFFEESGQIDGCIQPSEPRPQYQNPIRSLPVVRLCRHAFKLPVLKSAHPLAPLPWYPQSLNSTEDRERVQKRPNRKVLIASTGRDPIASRVLDRSGSPGACGQASG